MASNVTVIPGATQIGYYFRNYTYADMLTDLPFLAQGWATDLAKPMVRGASGAPLKVMLDASGATNMSSGQVPKSDSDGALVASTITDDGSIVATASKVVIGGTTTSYSFEAIETLFVLLFLFFLA